MSQTYAGSVKIVLANTFTNTLPLGNSVVDNLAKTLTAAFTNGMGSGKAQILAYGSSTLLTNTSEELDLTALGTAYGDGAITKIKALIIWLDTATTGYRLEVGAAASNAISTLFGNTNDVLKVTAGGILLLTAPVDGYAITADTADILKINNPSGGSVTYNWVVIGEGSVA